MQQLQCRPQKKLLILQFKLPLPRQETVCHVPQIVYNVIKLAVQSVFLVSSFIMDNVANVLKMEYTQIKMFAYNVTKVAKPVMVIYLVIACLVNLTIIFKTTILVNVMKVMDILFKVSIVQNAIKAARLAVVVYIITVCLVTQTLIFNVIKLVNVIQVKDILFKISIAQNVIKVARLVMEVLAQAAQLAVLVCIYLKIIHAKLAIKKWDITFKDKVVKNVIKVAKLVMKTLKNVQVVLLNNTCKKIILVQLLVIQTKGFLFKIINVQHVIKVVQHVLISTGGSCQPCDKSCAKCKGPSNKDCLACSKNYILLPSIGKCALCEEGYFFNQNNCQQCNQMCTTCFGKNENECIDCRGGLTLSSITKTCQSSSQIENENNLLEYSKIVGCYNQTDQQVVSSCLDQIERSKSSTQNMDTLAVINLSLIVASSIFTPIGSSLAWTIMDELTRNENELCSSSIYLYSKYLYSTSQKRRKTLLVQSIQHSIIYQ
ncbi:transmembrane protein, putative (macronuclear) [Tetrahymena thermophila SB210]|uniref:Transmembrane protein, putative n=1 Tax=Tetrahymena thermophila (strain SB210) TaxID=312017 RepID=Q234V5_TETTS|nr:transmembrane protein, putative [Tetrahymena thermophila SB210]EAR91898.2 transmembrane protein, putative [Tetrahymena thermophila SB210]|eukprot:XP_001012143.2 transmembrane protein, putative [Tetrahymena thermophila SB210]